MESRHHRQSTQPLDDDQRVAARRVAERLVRVLTTLVDSLPAHARGGAGMARLLGIDRSTCQRIVTALGVDGDVAEVLSRAPGVEGLTRFVQSMRARGASTEALRHAEDATSAFAELISDLAGSQAGLVRRLAAVSLDGDESLDPADEVSLREQAFEALALLTRRHTQAQSNVLMFRPVPGDDGRVEVVSCRSYFGLEGRSGAPPVSGIFFARADDELEVGQPSPRALDREPGAETDARGQVTILEEFSSSPTPRISTVEVADVTLQLVEPPVRSAEQAPVDLTLAYRIAPPILHPAKQQNHRLELYYHCVVPTRVVVLNVYMHRGMASNSVPFAEVHQRSPDVPQELQGNWFDRLDSPMAVEVLGPELRTARHPAVPRQEHLLAHLFDAVGWPRGDFVGYRVVIPFPIWGCRYTFGFQFQEPGQ